MVFPPLTTYFFHENKTLRPFSSLVVHENIVYHNLTQWAVSQPDSILIMMPRGPTISFNESLATIRALKDSVS